MIALDPCCVASQLAGLVCEAVLSKTRSLILVNILAMWDDIIHVGIASGLVVESQEFVYDILMFPCAVDCRLDISFNVLE